MSKLKISMDFIFVDVGMYVSCTYFFLVYATFSDQDGLINGCV